MSEKFTPGPWKAGKNPYMTTILDGYEGKAIYMDDPNIPHHIAWANAENYEGDLDVETALANATLIATAPEMFKELERLSALFRKNSIYLDEREKIESILRKARGESEESK